MLDAAPAGLSVCGWQQLRPIRRTPVLPTTRVEPRLLWRVEQLVPGFFAHVRRLRDAW
jgi:hypothetical protein